MRWSISARSWEDAAHDLRRHHARTRLEIEKLVIESNDTSRPIVDFHGRNGCDLIIRSWEIVGTLPAGQIAANRSGARGNMIERDPQGQPPGTRNE